MSTIDSLAGTRAVHAGWAGARTLPVLRRAAERIARSIAAAIHVPMILVPLILVPLLAPLIAVFCAPAFAAQSIASAAPPGRDSDAFLIVDCALPAQVRQLGTAMTYLAPRRAVKTSASDCAIRGGEYVAHDRASLDTALKVWLPLAQGGDQAAQANVGEIYEKGIGGKPDYANAAKWYRLAADRGYPRALTNLGFLYERGLGVARDPVAALQLYRKAAGIAGTISLEGGGTSAASRQEIDTLRKELERTRDELEKSRRLLDENRLKSSRHIESLLMQKQQAAAAGNTEETRRLETLLAARETELAKQKEQVERLEGEAAGFKSRLAAFDGTRQELDQTRRLLDEQRRKSAQDIERLRAEQRQAVAAGNQEDTRRLAAQLAAREAELAKQKGEIERLAGEVGSYKAQAAALDETRQALDEARRLLEENRRTSREEIERLQARKQQAAAAGDKAAAGRLEALLKGREGELAQQKANVERLEREVGEYKARVARLETAQPAKLEAAQSRLAAAVAPPSIQILDPQVVITRDIITVKVRSGVQTREIVGRVTAPAGLMSLTANDLAQKVDANGMFKTTVELGAGKTKVALLAVDRQGKVSQLQFYLEPDARSAAPTAVAPPRLPGIATGNYHALIIGNQRYTKLQPLETPEADVTQLAPILRDKYGFKVTLLLNATRYQILTAMNDLRARLTEKDNLLIYYAGHGELDRVNGLANWLPVDAEPSSNANWISSSSITEMLNAMAARHILVVADSCYSGALTRSSVGQLETGLTEEARFEWLKQIAATRSRTALTSGGLKPVLDGGGGKFSVFASIFIDILSQNQDVLEGMRIYREISARVVNIALRQKFEQRPEYGAIRFAGGESGDFLFVPRN